MVKELPGQVRLPKPIGRSSVQGINLPDIRAKSSSVGHYEESGGELGFGPAKPARAPEASTSTTYGTTSAPPVLPTLASPAHCPSPSKSNLGGSRGGAGFGRRALLGLCEEPADLTLAIPKGGVGGDDLAAASPNHIQKDDKYSALLEKLNPDRTLVYSMLGSVGAAALEAEKERQAKLAQLAAAKAARQAALVVNRRALGETEEDAMEEDEDDEEDKEPEHPTRERDIKDLELMEDKLGYRSINDELVGRCKNDVFRDAWDTIDQDMAPMRVVSFQNFEQHGSIPEEKDGLAEALLRLLWESKVVFISHRWTRPPVRDEAGEVLEPGSPDDDNNTKYRLICKGVEALMKQLHWKKHQTYLWMDFCCVKQEDGIERTAGLDSMWGYLATCNAMLIPSMQLPTNELLDVSKLPGDFTARGWCRFETLGFAALAPLNEGDLFVCANDASEKTFFKQFKVNFATGAAPSTGLLSVEGDREFIKYHEKFILELLALAKKDKEVLRGLVKKEQLAGLNMTAEHAPVLLEACKATPHVQSMNLEGNCMGPEGGGVLAELLANDMWARHLKQLTLDGNKIGPGGAKALASVLGENRVLTVLELEDNELGDGGAKQIGQMLKSNSTLMHLDLTSNEVGPDGVKALVDALKGNKTLTNLTLSSNLVGDEGAKMIAKCMAKNKSVCFLDLQRNELGVEGMKVLFEVVVKQKDRWVSFNSVPVRDLRTNQVNELLLGEKGIGDMGCMVLGKTLSLNTSLTVLDLQSNEIGVEGAMALNKGLMNHIGLTELNMNANLLKGKGLAAMQEMLCSNKSLLRIDFSGNDIVHTGGVHVLNDAKKKGPYLLTLDDPKPDIVVLRRKRVRLNEANIAMKVGGVMAALGGGGGKKLPKIG